MGDGAGTEFAVLVPVIEFGGRDHVLLTKRPEALARYSGQVSFPGGARDPGDRDLKATAIREAGEEVGISPDRITVTAELPWYSTTLGHRVKPFLARVAPGPVRPSPEEVERILYLPLDLFDVDPFGVRTFRDRTGALRTTLTLCFDGLEIWGLTARILRGCFTRTPSS